MDADCGENDLGVWVAVGEGVWGGVGESVGVGGGEALVGEAFGRGVTDVEVAVGVPPGVASGLSSGGDVGVGASIFAVGVAGSSPVGVGVDVGDVVAEVQAINVAARDKLSQMIGLLQVENVIPIRHLRAIVELTRNRQFG